jgi:hypothetical protein
MSRSSGYAELDAMIATVRAIPRLTVTAAPDVALAVRDELARTIAAGTTPSGVAWRPRKDDGGPVLKNAAAAIHVGAVGSTIYVRLTGPEARHHLGSARGGTMRQVIPVGVVPAAMGEAVRRVLVRHFDELVKGGP